VNSSKLPIFDKWLLCDQHDTTLSDDSSVLE